MKNVPYPAHALYDAREAIAFIRTQAPGRRVIVAGLCSGAWHAFQAAREGLAVDAVMSINPPLYLRDGMTRTHAWNDYQQIETYRTGLREPACWKRALRGQSAYRSFFRLAALYAVKKMKGLIGVAFGAQLVDGLARDLAAIGARGIPCFFVFSRGDGGLEYFQLHAKAAPPRRGGPPSIQHEIVDDAGHTFNPPAAQRAVRTVTRLREPTDTRCAPGARESSRAVEPRSLTAHSCRNDGEAAEPQSRHRTAHAHQLFLERHQTSAGLIPDAARRQSGRGGERWMNDFLTYSGTSQTVSIRRAESTRRFQDRARASWCLHAREPLLRGCGRSRRCRDPRERHQRCNPRDPR